ncbi:arginase family protein [Carboxydothermus pertinax]|uniref:Arginase n=1 Tax=Carboxydothermus pertinax TaxID=870242 RepID=A0A1L8CWT9_9THEO|nr:arginase family protein [Carboxydothermus pertinax]GAV23341.1 hypothetical protein cpu_18510 [Carboxydothermus pertinax]
MGLVFKDVGVIDLDGSVMVQENLLLKFKPKIYTLPGDHRLKIWTNLSNYHVSCQKLGNTVLGINFCGTGEFHHLTYYLVKNNPAPRLGVVVFDNHPDFLPTFSGYISCGSWLLNVAALDKVKQILVVGVTELSGLKSFGANLAGEKIILLAPKGKKVPTTKYPIEFYAEDELFAKIEETLKISDIYISIDKDVLHPLDSTTTWEQGELRLKQLLKVLAMLKNKYRIWGVDICGEYGSALPQIQRAEEKKATSQNEKANLQILEALLMGE